MIRAVCFDLDGTLAEYRGDFSALMNQMQQDLGMASSGSRFRSYLGQFLRWDGPITLHTAVKRTIESLERTVPNDLHDITALTVNRYAQQIEWLPTAQEGLAFFGRWPLALLSNGPADLQRAAVAKLGLAPRFKTILISGDADVGLRKPDPRLFKLLASRLGVPLANILMIGDNLEADIQGATAAGMQALHIPATGSSEQVR